MARKTNYGKIIIVAFITLLIWVWADLSLDEEIVLSNAVITVSQSVPRNLSVAFDTGTEFEVKKLVLKGPSAKVSELRRKIKDKLFSMDFEFDPTQENIDTPGDHTIQLLNFFQNKEQIKNEGLAVIDCEPRAVTVNIDQLVKAFLDVECIGPDDNPITQVSITPTRVEMFAPQDKETARINLSESDITQARTAPLEKTPYIVLPSGQIRQSTTSVQVSISPQQDLLNEYTITTGTIGFILSANLQGQYKVEMKNRDEVIRNIRIRATAESKAAYENLPYQVILEIRDEDASQTEPITREVIYNFPAQYQRRDEIELNQPPVDAQFTLTPVDGSAAEGGP